MSALPTELLYAYGLAFCRDWGMCIILPFGEGGLGWARKGILAAVLALLGVSHVRMLSDELFALSACTNLLWGIILGIPAACLVGLASAFGDLFDTARGQSIASIFDPLQEASVSISSGLIKQLSWVQLLCLGLLEELVVQYQRSFSLSAAGIGSVGELSERLLLLVTSSASHCFALFIPFALLFLLIEFAVGFLTKTLSNGALSSEAMQIKSYLGFALLLLSWEEGIPQAVLGVALQPLSLFVG